MNGQKINGDEFMALNLTTAKMNFIRPFVVI